MSESAMQRLAATHWSLFPVSMNADRVGSTGKRTIWNFKLLPWTRSIVHVPVESALFAFGETSYGNENGGQCGTTSLHATAPLIMNVSLSRHWLLNKDSNFKIWAACPYMLSVSLIRCANEALKKCTSRAKASASKSENRQVTDLLYSFSPSARINHKPDGLLNGDIQS